MILPLFLLVFHQIPQLISAYNFEADYKKLAKNEFCDKGCYFDQAEITLKTVGKWPASCHEVCGIITLNENCDVSTEKLKTTFKKLSILHGGVRIENTSFTTLSFLPHFESFCSIIGTSIVNNSALVNVDSISEMYQWDECFFRMSDNPKLDAIAVCDSDYFKDRLGLKIFGNKVDCGCPGGKINSKNTLVKLSECEAIEGNLVITDISDPLTIIKVRKITGDLEVKKTNLTSLSFMEKLEEVKSKSHVSNKRVIINIHDNYRMTSLGLKALKNLTNIDFGHFMINLQNLHAEFCLSVDEMRVFLDSDAQFSNIEAVYCMDQLPRATSPKLCVFERMSSLESDCEHILGDILIESGDEDYVDKLKTVTHVFGTITIRNTELDNCKFLKNLRRIAALSASLPAMQILANKNLRKLALPSIENFIARTNRIVIDGNSADIFEKTSECMTIQLKTQTNVTYNGGTCKTVNKTRENSIIPYDDDYSEIEDLDWEIEYEGVFYQIDATSYQLFYDILEVVNDVTAVIGFIVNIFHLIVLFQKDLRTNFIYIMMIGISICDTLLVLTFISEYALENEWFYEKSICGFRPYFHVVLQILEPVSRAMTRRCSSLLAFAMALFRTCSVMFPMSSAVVSVSRPKIALSLVLGLFGLCMIWDYSLLIDCRIEVADDDMCEMGEYTAYMADCASLASPDASDDDDDIHILWYKIFNLIDGFSTITIGLLYLIVTIGLLIQIQSAQKRRKSLKSEKSENTSLLVSLMAVTFFLSGFVYGSKFIIDEFVLKYYSTLQYIKEQAEVLTWTLLIINSAAHCLICFFMSAQYRSAAKRVFWRRERNSVSFQTGKNSFAADLATISMGDKTWRSSAERSF